MITELLPQRLNGNLCARLELDKLFTEDVVKRLVTLVDFYFQVLDFVLCAFSESFSPDKLVLDILANQPRLISHLIYGVHPDQMLVVVLRFPHEFVAKAL